MHCYPPKVLYGSITQIGHLAKIAEQYDMCSFLSHCSHILSSTSFTCLHLFLLPVQFSQVLRQKNAILCVHQQVHNGVSVPSVIMHIPWSCYKSHMGPLTFDPSPKLMDANTYTVAVINDTQWWHIYIHKSFCKKVNSHTKHLMTEYVCNENQQEIKHERKHVVVLVLW